MESQIKVPWWWQCYEWYRTDSICVGDCSWEDCKKKIGVGEGDSWWLGRFKGVFRYRFGRLDFEDRWFNFIPRDER